MVAVPRRRYVPPEEYLLTEAGTEQKQEYRDGIIVAMAGASPAHNQIVFNVIAALGAQLRAEHCRGYGSDMRVGVSACNAYYYPDIAIACSTPQFEIGQGLQSLLNPTVLIEVLSDSTEKIDRGIKFLCYQTLPSLRAYLLVSQDSPLVEVYLRQSDDSWSYRAHLGMGTTIPLVEINATLALDDVYVNIIFE